MPPEADHPARTEATTCVIAGGGPADQPAKSPLLVRMANRVPALRSAMGYGVAIGPLPEHVPEFARR